MKKELSDLTVILTAIGSLAALKIYDTFRERKIEKMLNKLTEEDNEK